MFSDAVDSVCLQEWPLTATIFDGDGIEGPVPRLFTSALDEARAAFTSNIKLAHKDISRMMAKLFIPENPAPLNGSYLHATK